MLELSAEQLHQLALLEARSYVDRVYNTIVAEQPEQDILQLHDRLYQAYDHALKLGFRDSASLTQCLYFEAAAPEFYKEPAIDAWLRKPGAPVEQRWADLIATLLSKLPKEAQ